MAPGCASAVAATSAAVGSGMGGGGLVTVASDVCRLGKFAWIAGAIMSMGNASKNAPPSVPSARRKNTPAQTICAARTRCSREELLASTRS